MHSRKVKWELKYECLGDSLLKLTLLHFHFLSSLFLLTFLLRLLPTYCCFYYFYPTSTNFVLLQILFLRLVLAPNLLDSFPLILVLPFLLYIFRICSSLSFILLASYLHLIFLPSFSVICSCLLRGSPFANRRFQFVCLAFTSLSSAYFLAISYFRRHHSPFTLL